jgi:hypothetical protein
VDEVVGHVDALQRRVEPLALDHVARDDLDAGGQPGALGAAHQRAHAMAVLEQRRKQAAAHVPGRAGQQDGSGLGVHVTATGDAAVADDPGARVGRNPSGAGGNLQRRVECLLLMAERPECLD